jgi:Na+/proline symporter
MQAVDLNFDWENRYNLWSGLIGGTFLALSYFGTDQSQVQRYLTGKSIRHMRISLLFNAVVKVPLQFVILLTGALVFAFFVYVEPPLLFNPIERAKMEERQDGAYQAVQSRYQAAWSARSEAARRVTASREASAENAFVAANTELGVIRQEAIGLVEESNNGETYNDTNYIFLNFVIGYLPAGLVGLVMAAVFAAAMSTISAELNSLATVTVIDHYRRYLFRNRTDKHYQRAAKISTAFWGVYATVFASFGGQLGSLIEAVNVVGSLFYGSMLGVFVLAFSPWRVNGFGAFSGMIAGLAAVAWTASYTEVTFLWYNLIGCVVTVAVGLALGRGATAES